MARPSHSNHLLRKGAIVLLLLFVAWFATATAISGVLPNRAPAVTLQWAPWSTAARIALSNAMIGDVQSAPPAVTIRARTLAQQALDRSPVQAAAARLIGLGDLLTADEAGSRKAFAYAERLSRRDLPTELYWIETNVSRGDIPGALHHYDIAMRTSVQSRVTLGNILIAAAAQPGVATELTRLLKTQPRWLPEFYQRLMGQGENPVTLHSIARAMAFDGRDPRQAPFVAMALQRLVVLGAYAEAQDLYRRSLHTPATTVRNAGFEQPNRLQPFDWTISDDPSHTGVVETRAGWSGGNVLTVTGAEASDVARQLLLLTPGRYTLRALTANVRAAPETRPLVTIACANGATVATVPFAAAEARPAMMAGSFTVPADCPAQWLAIRNTPSFDPVDSDPWIDNIVVQRAGAQP
jgi:hypothetical protein